MENFENEKKTLKIINSNCWKCNEKMKIAMIDGDQDYFGPEGFSKKEIKLAEEHGVLLKIQHSKTMDESYLANTCPHCGNFVGQFFVLDHFLDVENPLDIESFDVGE